MARTPATASRPRPSADNDVYTVLVLVSFLSMLGATLFVAYKSVSMFGSMLPPGGS